MQVIHKATLSMPGKLRILNFNIYNDCTELQLCEIRSLLNHAPYFFWRLCV